MGVARGVFLWPTSYGKWEPLTDISSNILKVHRSSPVKTTTLSANLLYLPQHFQIYDTFILAKGNDHILQEYGFGKCCSKFSVST